MKQFSGHPRRLEQLLNYHGHIQWRAVSRDGVLPDKEITMLGRSHHIWPTGSDLIGWVLVDTHPNLLTR